MLAITVCAMASVEESTLLNPSQLVSGIIQACSWLISLDCIRIKLCRAIWSVSPEGAGLSHVCKGTAHQAAVPRRPASCACSSHYPTAPPKGDPKDALYTELLPDSSQSFIWKSFSFCIFNVCSLDFYFVKRWCGRAIYIYNSRFGHLLP